MQAKGIFSRLALPPWPEKDTGLTQTGSDSARGMLHVGAEVKASREGVPLNHCL